MKGTSDEFEVIHIHGMGLVGKDAKAIPGLMHYPFDEDSYERKFVDLVFCGSYHGIVAFDRDGLEVTRTQIPTVGDNTVFSFYPSGDTGDMKNEVLLDLECISEYKMKRLNGG